jgi:hypothetical protein
MVDAQNKAAGG